MSSPLEWLNHLSNYQPGFSLPQHFYTSDDVFQADLEFLYYREWLFVGHTGEIPDNGDYLRYEIGNYDIIVIRGNDGHISAFQNTCRHRGSRLCQEHKGNKSQLVCPYHQWTYDLAGKLKYAKDMDKDFKLGDYNLHNVHCQSFAGNIYICLAEQAPDFTAFQKYIEPYLLPHNLNEAKVAHQSDLIEEGNWKLVIENNRECYHCQGSHPELCRTYSDNPSITGVTGDADQSPEEVKKHLDKCEKMGLPAAFHLSDDGQYRVARMPLTNGAESFTLTGKAASKKTLTEFEDRELGTLMLFHYPNTWNHFLSDHSVTFRVTPLSHNKTMVTTKWLVHKDAVEGIDYDLETLTAVWNATNQQDRQLVEENQRGIESANYSPGPYSKTHEDGVIQFINWYRERMLKSQYDTIHQEELSAPTHTSKQISKHNKESELSVNKPGPSPLKALVNEKKDTMFDTELAQKTQFQNMLVDSNKIPFLYLDQTKPWQSQTEVLNLVNIVPETSDVKTFSFRTESENWFNFAPGQFITLELPVNNKIIYRTYTISSSPSRPLSLSVTVKLQPDSIGGRWMFENLKVGMKIRAFGPTGEFNLYNHPADKYCFISAGSGITPMLSMTKYLFDRGGDIDISFINCSRSPSSIIARDQIERLSARVPGIQPYWIVSDRDPYSAWPGYKGRMNQLILELTTPDYFEREIFCCGPDSFMQNVRDILNAAGFNMQHYHEESFSAPVYEASPATNDDIILDENIKASVTFLNSGATIESNQATSLLDASLNAGLNIPSACQFGVCGTCKIKKVSGEIHMVHNGGISDKEIAQGYVLACCSTPLTDVELLY